MSGELTTHVPSYLQTLDVGGDGGYDDLKDLMRVSRLYMVQPMSDQKIKEKFQEGDLILMPEMELVSSQKDKTPFLFTPILKFTEYLKTNPIDARGKEDWIIDRTMDAGHEIARRATSRDKAINTEPSQKYPGKEIKYLVMQSFLVALRYQGAPVNPVLMAFKSAEIPTAQSFGMMLMARQGLVRAMWANVFECKPSGRKSNARGQWFGFDISNPSNPEDRFVPENEFQLYTQLRTDLAEKVKSGLFKPVYDTDADADLQPGNGNGGPVDTGVPNVSQSQQAGYDPANVPDNPF